MNKSKSFVCVWKSVKISKKDNRAFSSIRPTSQLASTKCRFVDWHLSSSHRAPCSEIHFRFVDKKAREGWSRQRQKHQQHFVSFKLSLSISNSFYLYLFLYFDLLSLTLSCCSLSNSVLLMSLYLTLSYFSLQLYIELIDLGILLSDLWFQGLELLELLGYACLRKIILEIIIIQSDDGNV